MTIFKMLLSIILLTSTTFTMANTFYEKAVKNHKDKDYVEAIDNFKKSFKGGNLEAGFALATMFYYGEGVTKDFDKAKGILYEVADKGHPSSQALLGLMAQKGEGGEKDLDEAIRWMERAAAQCDITAQIWVAQLYWTAKNEYKDNVKAFVWSAIASLQGSKDSLELMVKSKESLSESELEKAKALIQLIKSKNKCLTQKPQQ